MSTPLLPRHALAGGPAEALAGRGLSRPAVVVSVLAHVAVLYAASQWYETEPPPFETMFEWLTVLEAPSEPAAQPALEVVEPPCAVAVRVASPPVVLLPQPESPADVLPAPPVGPSRFDLDAARREAAAAVVEERARASTVRAPSIDDAPLPPPPRTSAPKKPSIFDHQASSGRSLMQPGKQRSVAGQRFSLWCNKISGGGFGFFGIPVCASQGIQPPSGILADSIPEYMKLKPECEETAPLAATLGEASPYPTKKCRLVPKDPDE